MGLETVDRFDPVTFEWKQVERRDLGLIAEDVERIDPILVTYNQDGQVEGVKYKQLTTVVINAVKELKAENETLKLENVKLKNQLEEKTARQQKQIDELRDLIKEAID
jgi:hypothetical protein